ncbi:MAG: hypothetical protein MR675_01190 [Lachnospira sp.]|nr:hypothetical protein [Lachnospira sp.]
MNLSVKGKSLKTKRINDIRRAVAVIAAFITVTMAVITCITLSASASAYDDTQTVLREMLGVAKPYGIFTEEFESKNHNETLFATNKLYTSDQYFSSPKGAGKGKDATGTIYFKEAYNGGNGNLIKFDGNIANNVVVGTDYVKSNDGRYLNFKNSDVSLDISNCQDINIYYDVNGDFLNVTKAIENVKNKFGEYYNTEKNTKSAKVDFSDMNNSVIDVTECDSQICVVNITQSQLDGVQNGGIKINKKLNQFVIINVKDITSESVNLCKEYYVNDNGKRISSSTDDQDVADTVIWNFGEFDGEVEIGMTSGIIVAPNAEVSLYNTSRGRVVANKFSNISGEFHFIAFAIEKETEKDTTEGSKETQTETKSMENVTKETQTETKSTENVTKETQTETKSTENVTKETQTETKSTENVTKETQTETKSTENVTKETQTETKSTENVTKETQTETKSTENITKETQTETKSTENVTKETQTEIVSTERTTKTPEVGGDEEIVTKPSNKDPEVGADEEVITRPQSKTPEVGADEEVVTGDNSHIAVYVVIIVVAVVVLAVVLFMGKKSSKKDDK